MTPVWDPWALAAWCTACVLVIVGLACAVWLPAGTEAARARSGSLAWARRLRPRPELLWTVVALAAVLAVAVPATRARVGQQEAGGADLTVEVRASRWRWEYTYLDGAGARRFGFVSTGATPADVVHGRAARGEHYLRAVDRPLVIPTSRKVRFLVTSADVVHAFWVPDLGIRGEAVPGVVRTVWAIVERPGIYRGQCAAFCGERHALMPIVVEARSPQAFETWQSEAAQTLVAQGPRSGPRSGDST